MVYITAKEHEGEREWEDSGVTWVRHGTYTTKNEADGVAKELKAQGYRTEVEWINQKWKYTDEYWKGAKNYVVYKSKEPTETPGTREEEKGVVVIPVEDKLSPVWDPIAFLGSILVKEKSHDNREKQAGDKLPRQERPPASPQEPKREALHNGEEEGRGHETPT